MTIMGKVKKKTFYILIGSGSTHNFLDPSLIAYTDCEVEGIPIQHVTVANGSKICISQKVSKFQWMTQGVQFKVEAFIMPLESYHMVLGIQWLYDLGAVNWNFKELKMEFMVNGKQATLHGTRKPFMQLVNQKTFGKNIQDASMILCMQFYSSINKPCDYINTVKGTLPALSDPQCYELNSLLTEYAEIFSELIGLPPSRDHDHRIILQEGTNPISVRPYRYPALQKSVIERLIIEMKNAGIIRDSSSPFSSPIVLVKKKDGSWRFCVDYRELNAKTIKDKFPIPVVEELLDELYGSSYYSKLDLKSGYWQIRMSENDVEKTAFRTHEGHYEFLVMPFGLTNAPATFQKLMNSIFKPFLRKFVLVFLDDILVYSKQWYEHLEHLKLVFDVLIKHSLKVKKGKCEFATHGIDYLGHHISVDGVSTDPAKIQAIMEWPTPNSLKELRGFLGLTGYYRRFIKGYGMASKPLTELLKQNSFSWTEQANKSFQQLKQLMSSPPVLSLPNFDQPFVIETDASGIGIGAVLMQGGHPIAFFSKGLSLTHQKLPVYEREMLAMVAAVQKWRPYLIGNHFKIKTDHQSLKFLLQQRISTPAQQRWLSKLSGYDFEIVYKKGKENIVADTLSSTPVERPIEIYAVLQPVSTNLLTEIQNSWNADTQASDVINQLKQDVILDKPYSWNNNKLLWKGRLVVGKDLNLRRRIIQMIHADSTGGHSGFLPTLQRLKSIFYWRGMSKATKRELQECEVCQLSKYEPVASPGLLQPLPIPEGIWTDVSLDFIDGLPKSHGKDTILVVVDRLSKYAHFIALAHPFTAVTVAQVYLDNVYKLHGMPKNLISDRDAIFLSKFWQELLKLLKVNLSMSTAYHPQTDGQTEVVNRGLETYLRCMTAEKPAEWSKWLTLAEWWYNTNFHSSTKNTPYEIVYGQKPPLHIPYIASSASVETVDRSLQAKEEMLRVIKNHLHQAINRMKVQADKHRRERELQVGDFAYVKLQPYRQHSLARRKSYKLSPRFFGPFEVLAKVGKVAYKLKLPEHAKLHPVFHISLLKKKIGNAPEGETLPLEITSQGHLRVEPMAILKRRTILRRKQFLEQVLIQWSNSNKDDCSWEDLNWIRQQFPSFNTNP
ncbi:putative mitochondrial protein [Apostasia shenzhenica]|uniref:Putative mitochondrial protein n=1 Tax=Apostasia shenzhenica TaxID=1088818 RepID=A0A2I0BG85_9ASPA|nr:putative mitochondrial protein [Apostasia shenzhenica]